MWKGSQNLDHKLRKDIAGKTKFFQAQRKVLLCNGIPQVSVATRMPLRELVTEMSAAASQYCKQLMSIDVMLNSSGRLLASFY